MFSNICGPEHDLCDCIDKARRRTSSLAYVPGPEVGPAFHKPGADHVYTDDFRRSLTPTRCLEDGRCPEWGEQKVQEEKDTRFQEMLRIEAIQAAVHNLRDDLYRTNKTQQRQISERHRMNAESLHCGVVCKLTGWEQKREPLQRALDANLRQRKNALEKYHELEKQRLISRHKEEEDDAFVAVTKHLRCRENQQEGELSIMEKLKASQELELAALRKYHEEARDELKSRSSLERNAL